MSDQEYSHSEDSEQLHQHLTPSEIEAKAETSLDMVLATLKALGVELCKRPKILFKEEPCHFNQNLVAIAKTDIETSSKLVHLIGADLLNAGYQRYGLTLSETAINDAVEVSCKAMGRLFPKGIAEEDIILFSPVRTQMDELDVIIAHEVWHLVESEKGIFASEGFTHEGTATFVQNFFGFQKSEMPDIQNYYDVIYKFGAHIVEREIQGEPKPLLALLNPIIRSRIEACFKTELLPLLHVTILETFDPTVGDSFLRHRLLNDPIYQEFRNEPSPATYLLSLQKQGYHMAVQELAEQHEGIERIVQHMRGLLELGE